MLQFKKVAADKKVEGKGKKKKVIESVNGGGDDMISETEFVDYFSKIMKVETSHAKALFRVADTSGDGFLEYREFLGLLSILCCGGWKRPAHLASDRASWPASHGLGLRCRFDERDPTSGGSGRLGERRRAHASERPV